MSPIINVGSDIIKNDVPKNVGASLKGSSYINSINHSEGIDTIRMQINNMSISFHCYTVKITYSR